ncbi:hypothetical protein [Tateyamaria sp. SN3-11]|uniref:hypothetical protein n=1 Tax=Tateyamaria sp. SN3-11 TaxID=3092147 RepID=UPI0039EA7A98
MVSIAREVPDVEKHGGQRNEGPTEVLVCIVGDSYGQPNGLSEEQQYEVFKSHVEREFSKTFEEVDVAPGYSVPAFATIVQVLSDYWPLLVATFFLAKPVAENLEVWGTVAKGVRKFFTRSDVVLGRNAAAALALEAVFDDMDGIPKTLVCTRYFWRDRRFEEEDLSGDKVIQEGPRTEYLSMAIHFFRIRADGVEFEVKVDGKSVQTKRI